MSEGNPLIVGFNGSLYQPSGGLSNCTLSTCDIEYTIFKYRPSLGANAFFLACYVVFSAIAVFQMIRYKRYFYSTALLCGFLTEIAGYAGRVSMYQNTFNYSAFLDQIITLTIGAVFPSASIYFTLKLVVNAFGVNYSRVNPKWFLILFIPSDVLSLVLQAVGGALSSTANSDAGSKTGVNISLAGLAYQVFTLTVFAIIFVDYCFRVPRGSLTHSSRFQVFIITLFSALVLILARCAYRVYELSNGYSGPGLQNQGEFIAFESVFILVANILLLISFPYYYFHTDGTIIRNGDSKAFGRGSKEVETSHA